MTTGPLAGVRVVEIAGLGPAPHACMVLADLGADVIRIERPGGQALAGGPHDLLTRGRPSVALDLKNPEGIATVLQLVEKADVLVEGMRPGVMERLGMGPAVCLARNERLVYGRMTGWGQTGQLAHSAGHDLNYLSITGALHGLGQSPEAPQFPGSLLGDFGGGSTYLVIGVLAALMHARSGGRGQVVDAAVVDGTAHLNALTSSFLAAGTLVEERASNVLDGGRAYYAVYETADGEHMSVAALEPQFYQMFVDLLGVADDAPDRDDPTRSQELRDLIARRFLERNQADWIDVFEGTDACVAGIVPLSTAAKHPHLRERGTFVEHEGLLQPAPAPRFSSTPATLTTPPPAKAGMQTREALLAWGISDVDGLERRNVIAQA